MRKLINLIIVLFVFVLFPSNVFADGDVSVSVSDLNIKKGSSASFNINADNSAGRIDISSSNNKVASVSESSLFLDMQSGTVIVKGNSVGSAIITVYTYDVTSYDDEDLSGKSLTINVVVTEPINENKPSNDQSSTNQNNQITNNNLSKNNNIKSIKIEGYELTKIDDSNFELSVDYNVTSIKVDVIAEDSKAMVFGSGEHQLTAGENLIDVVVTSQSGDENRVTLHVTREEGLLVENLGSILETLGKNEFDVKINEDSIITSDIIKKIKDSQKKVNLNYFDNNDNLIFSWSIAGDKITDTDDFLISVSYISEYKEQIDTLSNNSDGLYVNIKDRYNFPSGATLKLNVNNKFKDGDKVQLYCYNNEQNNLTSVSNDLIIDDNYLEFEVNNCSDYFVTLSDNNLLSFEKSSLVIYILIAIIIIACLICLFFIKNKFNKKKKHSDNLSNNNSNNNSVEITSVINNDIENNESVINSISDNSNYVNDNVGSKGIVINELHIKNSDDNVVSFANHFTDLSNKENDSDN